MREFYTESRFRGPLISSRKIKAVTIGVTFDKGYDGRKIFGQIMRLDAPGLENETVRFEPFTSEHREHLRGTNAIKAMWRWMPALKTGNSLDRYVDDLLKRQKRGYSVTYSLYRQSDNAYAGIAGFTDIDRLHRSLRISFSWNPSEFASTPIYQHTQLLMMQRAYDWRARRLVWYVDTLNRPAQGVLSWIGATQEAILRKAMRSADGHWADLAVFSLIRAEIPPVIERIRAELGCAA